MSNVENAIQELEALMKLLRDPDNGCSWVKAQTLLDITPYTLEEAYELVDAVERQNKDDILDEVADLMHQVLFYAEIAKENGWFSLADIFKHLTNKLKIRNPHVFLEPRKLSKEEVLNQWNAIKAKQRNDEAKPYFDFKIAHLPSLRAAIKLQEKAANIGFDWKKTEDIFEKIQEELCELKCDLDNQAPTEKINEELGDVLSAVINLIRRCQADPEHILRAANTKFQSRLLAMELKAKEGNQDIKVLSLKELENLWRKVKMLEQRFDAEQSLKLVGNSKEMLKELLTILIADLEAEYPLIESAIDIKNFEQVRNKLHKLNGGLSYCSLPKLHHLSKHVEKLLREKRYDDAAPYFKPLLIEIKEAQKVIDNYLKEQ